MLQRTNYIPSGIILFSPKIRKSENPKIRKSENPKIRFNFFLEICKK